MRDFRSKVVGEIGALFFFKKIDKRAWEGGRSFGRVRGKRGINKKKRVLVWA